MDPITKQKIRDSFLKGKLQIKTVNPETQEVFYSAISDVMKHNTPHKRCFRVHTQGASATFTEDHSLFTIQGETLTPTRTSDLEAGSLIVRVTEDGISLEEITSIIEVESLEDTYDLCVPVTENFVLSNGILAHNSYSIGGISLDIERSSKYESLKGNAEGQLDKAAEIKARTTKLIRGLMQPKYGRGVRSSFGPNVGSGILSPRNFI